RSEITSGSCIHASSCEPSLLMSAPPLRCVRHEPVFVFAVTFSPRDCLLRGNITSALLAAQTFGLNYSVEAHICLMDGYARVDELPQPVPDFRVVDAGRVLNDCLECFFDGHFFLLSDCFGFEPVGSDSLSVNPAFRVLHSPKELHIFSMHGESPLGCRFPHLVNGFGFVLVICERNVCAD